MTVFVGWEGERGIGVGGEKVMRGGSAREGWEERSE